MLTLSQTSPDFYMSASQIFRKHCEKRRNALSKQFLLFPQCFRPVCYFHQSWNCRLQTLSDWKSLKFVVWKRVNSLPNNKILDLSKLKAVSDDIINVTEKLEFVLGRVKNIVGKGENAGYQHFPLFTNFFQNVSFSRSLKVVIVSERVNIEYYDSVCFLSVVFTSTWFGKFDISRDRRSSEMSKFSNASRSNTTNRKHTLA